MGTIIFERNGHRYMAILSNPGVRLIYMNTGEELVRHRPKKVTDTAPVGVSAPPPAAPQPAPTVAGINVTGNLINVTGVSQAGTCFAMVNNNPNALSGETIEATAAVMFDVPAGTTTSANIGVVGKYLHLTIKANGLYSADQPQRVGNTPPG